MSKYIAEVGLNHLGDSKLCLKMINKALSCGVDGISLQIFPRNYYDNSKPHRRELNKSFYEKVARYLKKKKVSFGLAVTDSSVVNNFSKLKIDFWKILSFEFHNDNLIKAALKTKRKVYLSTGVASIKDIKKISKKYKNINFIHTTLSSNINKANISAIETMKKAIKNKKISFTLHSKNDEVIIPAVLLGADPIFFYVKNNDKRFYPDDIHAIKLDDLKAKIELWKKIKSSMGNGVKKKLPVPRWVYV